MKKPLEPGSLTRLGNFDHLYAKDSLFGSAAWSDNLLHFSKEIYRTGMKSRIENAVLLIRSSMSNRCLLDFYLVAAYFTSKITIKSLFHCQFELLFRLVRISWHFTILLRDSLQRLRFIDFARLAVFTRSRQLLPHAGGAT